MSTLPPTAVVPTMAVGPVEPATAPQTNTPDTTNGEGKNFAEVLDKVSTPDQDKPETEAKVAGEHIEDLDPNAIAVDPTTTNIAVSVVNVVAQPTIAAVTTQVGAAAVEYTIGQHPIVERSSTRETVAQVPTSPLPVATTAASVSASTGTPDENAPQATVPATNTSALPTSNDTAVQVAIGEQQTASETGSLPGTMTPATDETAVDAGTKKLLESLTKAVETAAVTGQPIDKPAGAEPGLRSVVDALSTITRTENPVATPATPATSGADVNDIPAPARQIVQLVAPLRQHGDGDYKLLLQLHPEHLGRVEVAVSLNQGQISMQMSTDNSGSRQLLRESMNELRQALSDAGLDAGSLDVGSHDLRENNSNNAESGRSTQTPGIAADTDQDEFFARLAPVINHNTNTATDGPLDVHV